ncbi:hypothetical protein N7468_007589 [Penicillium chermesinum]|uniref:Pathway-specific nitrogen regulator n=1 Tax=Penicillium chermesinum TaxID=63820 RepID=A0A9W9NUI5_9EURO|nr:uncharacterized protein N7468_007589 [Penicillium chermesinum]KAJ5226364.1 hypothetical protein N7468_007589 [Penicillium chermesinum]
MPDSDSRSGTDDGMSRDYEYNSSGSSRASTDQFSQDMDNDPDHLKSRASSRSSLSSMPASVLVHPTKQSNAMLLHEKIAGYTIEDDEERFGGFADQPRSMRTIRPREAGFRKPSSVRAMQMHTEDEADDDDYLTPPRRRTGMRSPGNPSRRSPYYSPKSASEKPKPKREFPLVLLHCNLLPPSMPVVGAAEPRNQALVEEALPAPFWKRWRRLQEKVGSGVVRDRGVLISHPEDLYDLLEERLLESLELQRARVSQGHFLGHEDREECPDCGGRVVGHGDKNRKWEIRVYAANGLMRAGAWAAAWREMEKVDVEVGLWLPSDIRRALEKRIAEERSSESQALMAPNDAAKLGFDRRPSSTVGQSKAFSEAGSIRLDCVPPLPAPPVEAGPVPPNTQEYKPAKKHEIALSTLLFNYVRVLASDKRNIALVAMSVLVAFLSFRAGPAALQPAMNPFPNEAKGLPVAPIVEVFTPIVSVRASAHSSPSVLTADVLQEITSQETEHIAQETTIDESGPSVSQPTEDDDEAVEQIDHEDGLPHLLTHRSTKADIDVKSTEQHIPPEPAQFNDESPLATETHVAPGSEAKSEPLQGTRHERLVPEDIESDSEPETESATELQPTSEVEIEEAAEEMKSGMPAEFLEESHLKPTVLEDIPAFEAELPSPLQLTPEFEAKPVEETEPKTAVQHDEESPIPEDLSELNPESIAESETESGLSKEHAVDGLDDTLYVNEIDDAQTEPVFQQPLELE